MPRLAEDRLPAEPVSPDQRERYRRILRAAAKHGAAKGLERVQMLDVARDAGVAIATLYRYFPSKTHLFTALMRHRVERLVDLVVEPPAADPAEGIGRLLCQMGDDMLRTPLLTHAMVQSNNATVAHNPSAAVTYVFLDLMLAAGGFDEPTEQDLRLLRLVEQAWYGIVMSALNGHIGPTQVRADTELVCRLLLRDLDMSR
ncbi:TetR family transcriptional regulator [Nocardioides massiliensis]|uniref:AcrR family transcriptional regulator n=1 Tax=Nocardioides massiliensis TaxID=1325935 RepID=A0ABT9NNE4_9ACTN|nr:TetR family transcriptional regulator [Nocardioides massiliensis]MDP9821935.1 AcrR family transcriptional regulator [Nocardioides massiliensis]